MTAATGSGAGYLWRDHLGSWMAHKFDPKNIARLDDPERAKWQSVEPFLKLLRPRAGMVCADIGCGPGYFALSVAERVGPGGRVYAIDLQPEMLRELERRARDRGLANVVAVRSRESGIPLPDSCVDAAFTANTFHELEEPVALLREVRRILKPDGRLLVIDWKPIETPVGTPVGERVPLRAIIESLERAGFGKCREHAIYAYHNVVESVSA